MQQRWIRIAPHVVDALLLASAIALAIITRQYPFVHGWLTAKVLALLVYIGLGMTMFRCVRAGTQGNRCRLLYACALLVAFYIVAAALSKSAQIWI